MNDEATLVPPSSLTIETITSTVFRLPMAGTLQWGKHSTLREAKHVLVEVTLSDGSMGVAEAPPRPTIYGETVYSITSIIAHELGPRLCGEPVSTALSKLHEVKNNQTAKGALDMALHDALAQHHGLPLPNYLAQTFGLATTELTEQLRVSYILGIGDRESVLAEAQRVYNQGVRVLKVKVGRNWQADLALIAELETLFGGADAVDGMWLYADANECFTSDEAPNVLAAMRERGLLYCEEPLPVEFIQERSRLRNQEILPLIADDSCFSQRDLTRELALDTFDILNIKPARTGYTESATMLRMAQTAGKGVMIGSQASTGLGTIRCAAFAALPGILYPSELSFFLKVEADLLSAPLCLHRGYLHLVDLSALKLDRDRLRDVTVTLA